jgi:hypothetical protein
MFRVYVEARRHEVFIRVTVTVIVDVVTELISYLRHITCNTNRSFLG